MTSHRYHSGCPLISVLLVLSILLLEGGWERECLAKPAWRGPVRITQKDGSTFLGRVHGDEWCHYLTDLQGHAIIKDSDGLYCYCIYSPDGVPASTGYMVGERNVPSSVLSQSASIPLSVLSDNALPLRREAARLRGQALSSLRARRPSLRGGDAPLPPTDDQVHRCIVVLADFPDKKMSYTREDFEQMLLGRDYRRDGATGSAKEYFDEMLRGDMQLEFILSPIVTMDHDCAYYFGWVDPQRKDRSPAQFVAEACTKAHDAGVDFSLFDGDGDGQVDNVIIFAAGMDEAESGDQDCPWSHQWWVKDGGKINCTLDGVIVNRYALATEIGLTGEDGEGVAQFGFAPIGTFCHEFSHTLGLPDFYDTDNISSGGVADGLFFVTDLMDGGCYNNYSRTPPHWGAVDYHLLGLGKELTLNEGTTTLSNVEVDRTYIRYNGPTEGEYYLFDVRGEGKWDGSIGDKGLAVYHIDRTDPARWAANKINTDPSRQLAYLVTPDPSNHAFDSDGNRIPRSAESLFFPQGDITVFTSKTTPVFSFRNGSLSPLGLTDIHYDQVTKRASFTVINMADVVIPEIRLSRQDIFQDCAIIQMTSSDERFSSPAVVTVGSGPENAPTYADTLSVTPYSSGKYALRLGGLESGKLYRVHAHLSANGISGVKTELSFETKPLYESYPYITFRDIPRSEDGVFPKGSPLPLVVYNLEKDAQVEWRKDGAVIKPSSDGYYHLWTSGEIVATITYKDGSVEIIKKTLSVR